MFKVPYFYYIESKCTEEDRFDFSMITEKQRSGLLAKSQIDHVFGWVIVLFATYHRAFVINIQDIDWMEQSLNKHSLNINKVDKWPIPYKELQTVPSRKLLWDYTGEIEEYIPDKRSE